MAGIPREIVDAARAHEPDRYLAALLAPRAVRDDLVVLAAVHGEIARIPRVVSDPMLGEIRLQWWHDAIERLAAGFASGERTGNPLADALGGVILRHGLPQARLFDCVEARLFELYADPITDEAALARYLAGAEGEGFRLAAQVLGVAGSPAADAALVAAGDAYGLTRCLMALPFHLSRGHVPMPLTWPEVAGVTLVTDTSANADPRETSEAHPIRALVARSAQHVRTRLHDLRSHLADASHALNAAVLPCALVEPYLQALQVQDHDPTRHAVDVVPLQRTWRLWRAHWQGVAALVR